MELSIVEEVGEAVIAVSPSRLVEVVGVEAADGEGFSEDTETSLGGPEEVVVIGLLALERVAEVDTDVPLGWPKDVLTVEISVLGLASIEVVRAGITVVVGSVSDESMIPRDVVFVAVEFP